MSGDDDLPDEVDPAEGWEFAGRELLSFAAEKIEREMVKTLRSVQRLDDPSLHLPHQTGTDIRQLIYRLERLAEIADELDPAVSDPADDKQATADHGADATAVDVDSADTAHGSD